MERVCLLAFLAATVVCSAVAGRQPFSVATDFPGANVIVDSKTENEVRVRPDTRTSRGECAPRHWAFRVRNANGRKLVFRFPHDPIFGFLSIRGPAVSHDGGVSWKWMTDGIPANPPESFKYAFGPDENDVLFAWQPLYTEATLRRFIDKTSRAGAMIREETLCKTEKGRSAELLRIGNDANPGKVGVVLLARHHANEIWASFVLQGMIGKILSESPEGSFLRENVSFFIVPFVDKDGVEDGDPGKDRKPHDHNRDYDKDRYSTIRAIKQKATEWARDKKIVLGFDLHSCSLEVRGRRLHDQKAWAHNMLFQLVRTTTRDEPSVRLFSGLLRRNHPNERSFIQYLPATDSIETGPVAKGSAAKSRDWMFTALDTKYVATLETPFARPDGRPNTPEAAEELGGHIAKTIADFVRETLAYAKKSLTAD